MCNENCRGVKNVSHGQIKGSIPGRGSPIYTVHEAPMGYFQGLGTAHEGGCNGQSIGSTVSDVIVHSWCGRLQQGVSHWATSVALLQVADN